MWSRPNPGRPDFSRPELARPRSPGIYASLRGKRWSCLCWSCRYGSDLCRSWHRRSWLCLIEPVRFIPAAPERGGVVEAVRLIRARLETPGISVLQPERLPGLPRSDPRRLRLAALVFLGRIRARLELAWLVERRGPIRTRFELARLAEPAWLMQLGIKPDRFAGITALCVELGLFELGLLNGSRSEPLAVGGPHVGTCIRLGSTRPMPGRMGASPSHIGHQSPLCYLRRRMARSTSRVASLRASSCRLS
jgi:hypothetical protein